MRRRRRRRPFEAGCAPGIVARILSIKQRPDQIDRRQKIGRREHRRASRRHDVIDLKFRRVDVVAARIAEIAEQELGKKGEVEAKEHQDRREPRPGLVIELADDFRPPEVQRREEGRNRAADHDVMEMRDHEIGVVHLHVDGDRGEEQPRQAADREQPDEAERIEHRRFERDLAAIERRRPVEHFDRRGDRHHERQKREDQAGVGRLPGDEHVVAPDEEADARDRHHRIDHEGVAEHAAPGEAGDHFRDDAHRGQDHDVDRGMAVEPEQMLEQQRIAAMGGIEDRQAEPSLGDHKQQRDRQHRRRQHQDEARRIERPHEKRQAKPGHARCVRSMWIVTMKLTPVAIEPKPATKTPAAAASTWLFENIVENGV